MTQNRPILFTLVASGVLLFAVQPAGARHRQSTGSKPGIGVSGIGVSAVFVPAPGVATPTVRTNTVTTPMATGGPGVTSRNVTSSGVTSNPGVAAPGVNTRQIATPQVPTAAPAIGGLPQGYYTSIPSDAVQVMHRGEMVYSANGVFYRPEYYLGSLVYVRVPK